MSIVYLIIYVVDMRYRKV